MMSDSLWSYIRPTIPHTKSTLFLAVMRATAGSNHTLALFCVFVGWVCCQLFEGLGVWWKMSKWPLWRIEVCLKGGNVSEPGLVCHLFSLYYDSWIWHVISSLAFPSGDKPLQTGLKALWYSYIELGTTTGSAFLNEYCGRQLGWV